MPRLSSSGYSMSASERLHWKTQAALLDPAAYVLNYTEVGGLDVTVPTGETWHMVNTFAVYFNTPTVYSQDEFPLTRRTGMLRWLDARNNVACPAGTRIRNNTGINITYIYYCNPSLVTASDDRYSRDPRGLYYERLERLKTLPMRELICEATGGGSIDDVVRVELPTDFDSGMLVFTGVLDACWMLLGTLNTIPEINNQHTHRTAGAVLCPFNRTGIGADPIDGKFYATLKKGTISDGWSLFDGSRYSSFDAGTAFPLKGAGHLNYHVLPADW